MPSPSTTGKTKPASASVTLDPIIQKLEVRSQNDAEKRGLIYFDLL
jgi:hypothetical protein